MGISSRSLPFLESGQGSGPRERLGCGGAHTSLCWTLAKSPRASFDSPPLCAHLQEWLAQRKNQGCWKSSNHSQASSPPWHPHAQAFSTQFSWWRGATANNSCPHMGGGCVEKAGSGTLVSVWEPWRPWQQRHPLRILTELLWVCWAAPDLCELPTYTGVSSGPQNWPLFPLLSELLGVGWGGKAVRSKVREVIFKGPCLCLPQNLVSLQSLSTFPPGHKPGRSDLSL